MSRPRLFVVFLALFTPCHFALAQDGKGHHVLSFDEKGKLEQLKAWPKVRDDIKNSNPNHVFVVAHGWRNSKERADETFAVFAKLLREQQGKDDVIQVVGVRWPSLLGENDGVWDLALKQAAQSISTSMGKSETVKEYKEKLKTTLKKASTRAVLSLTLKFQLPPDEQIDRMIDNMEDVEKVENALTMLSYYEMKRRAHLVGTTGLQDCLTQLQEALPRARFHVVGHSFGCKVCLSCLASEGRGDRQVDSATLLQAAVSAFCFAPKIDELEGQPKGAYVDVPKRVKGCISVTHSKNDVALAVAYAGASRAAGHVGELPGPHYERKLGIYAALGAKGILGLADPPQCQMCEKAKAYNLRPGLNTICGDAIIQGHNDIRREEVAWLIWSTARSAP